MRARYDAMPDPYGVHAARLAREAHTSCQAAAPFGIVATRLRREAEGMEARSEWLRNREAKREGAVRSAMQNTDAERLRVEYEKSLSGAQTLLLARPSELQKFRELARSRSRTWSGQHRGGSAAHNLEAGLNKLEAESGIDLDGDGDVGLANPQSIPSSGYTDRTDRQRHSDSRGHGSEAAHPCSHWYTA